MTLEEIKKECTVDNWDGLDAEKITPKTIKNAQKIVDILEELKEEYEIDPVSNNMIEFNFKNEKYITGIRVTNKHILFGKIHKKDFSKKNYFKTTDKAILAFNKKFISDFINKDL